MKNGDFVLIRDIFETKIEEKIDPVIKVGERQSERKLAEEIGSYVITPTIEIYLDDFLEHYTDTFRVTTDEIGVWISGYFGSGKSHLAKIVSLLIENRTLAGVSASKRFETRLPSDKPFSKSSGTCKRESIIRSLSRLDQCDSQVLAFNINTLEDSKSSQLPRLLLSQHYQSKGYTSNLIYARVIESEIDKRGGLQELHNAAEKLANKSWAEMKKNPVFYSKSLYKAACEVAPDVFESPEDVALALKRASDGELYNVEFLVRTILEDLQEREASLKKPCRLILVMDEAGQWIGDDSGRLAQLQALVENAASIGQGKIWIFVTTHEDMSSVYQNARALKADMKKIEPRFRSKWSLTTENIELVLEDRIFKKKLAGNDEVKRVYSMNPGVLRGIGELANTSQKLPECSEEGFVTFYPFFPYQIHLIPEIVKSLRSAGGRGEQMSGSTRTLLAITQDILRAGRRKYLDLAVGEMVSFDEVYHNLAGEAEVNPDARRELSRIEEVVPGATATTRKVAEVLYLLRGISYIPRTMDNISRLLVEHSTDDLSIISNNAGPELKRLMKAGLVAKIGDEYEFLTGEVRTFEGDVAKVKSDLRLQDLKKGLADLDVSRILGFDTVHYKNGDFSVRVFFDDSPISRDGHVEIRVYSPLAGIKLKELEDQSLSKEEQKTIFVLSGGASSFEENLRYYIAMNEVIGNWKGDPHKSEDAHKVASERESKDLEKLKERVIEGLREGMRSAKIVFRGSSRSLVVRNGQMPGEALQSEISLLFWPTLYPRFILFRIANEQRAIPEVLNGTRSPSPEIQSLGIYDKMGQIDLQSPLIDTICSYISSRQGKNERTLGADLISEFSSPPFGWDTGAVRVAVAALVRSGALAVQINKRPFTNPADPELQNALRRSNDFNKMELILEGGPDTDLLEEVRSLLIGLTGKRKIEETPAALAEAMSEFGSDLIIKAEQASRWSEPARLPLPPEFQEGKESFKKILSFSNPNHRIREIHVQRDKLKGYSTAVLSAVGFVDKNGQAFIEMCDFATSLKAMEHRIPESTSCRSFIANWRTAFENAGFIDDKNWRDLQGYMRAACLELDVLLAEWRAAACSRAQEALDRLPQDLRSNELPLDLQKDLSRPLIDFISHLEDEKDVISVSALPDRASRLVRELGEAMRKEKEKLNGPKPPKPKKVVKRLRIADIVTVSLISDLDQWRAIRDQLDERVRKELEEGKDVELI